MGSEKQMGDIYPLIQIISQMLIINYAIKESHLVFSYHIPHH